MPYKDKHLRKYKYFVAYIDGNTRTRYSYESDDKKGISLAKIRKLATTTQKGKYKSFIIYDNQTGLEIERYSNGMIVNKPVGV